MAREVCIAPPLCSGSGPSTDCSRIGCGPSSSPRTLPSPPSCTTWSSYRSIHRPTRSSPQSTRLEPQSGSSGSRRSTAPHHALQADDPTAAQRRTQAAEGQACRGRKAVPARSSMRRRQTSPTSTLGSRLGSSSTSAEGSTSPGPRLPSQALGLRACGTGSLALRSIAPRRGRPLRQAHPAAAVARRVPLTRRPPGRNQQLLAQHDQSPTSFIWTAQPEAILAKVKQGHQTLETIH